MKQFRLLVLSLSTLWISTLDAQDIHYTLFNMSPMTLNPALTGAYEGTARIGGIYRNQWANVISRPYVTPGVYLDAPIIRGFGKKDWVGVGAMNVTDRVGNLFMETTYSGLSLAYHASVGKSTVFTLGLQGARVQRKLEINQLARFADQYEISTRSFTGGTGDLDRSQINPNVNYTDINAGLLFRTKLDGSRALEMGLSAFHLNTPRYSMHGGTDRSSKEARRPMRLALHGQYYTPLKGKWGLQPTVLLQTTSGAFEGIGQVWGVYNLKKNVNLNVGAGYRVGDALQILVGMDYEDLRVAASYDMNVSSLAAVSQTVGGFEISAWYVLKMYKKPDVKPVIFCPRF